MAMFRHPGLKIIDAAHSRIAGAEMAIAHAYTEEYKAQALDEFFRAQRYLRRAVDTYRAWQSTDHDDYEEYPSVPYDVQGELDLIRD